MMPRQGTPKEGDNDSARLEAEEVRNPIAGVSRRRFSTTAAAGGLYTMLHQALGAAATSQRRRSGGQV